MIIDSGGDEKQAKKLAKDLRLGLQRAKTDMGIEDDQPRGQSAVLVVVLCFFALLTIFSCMLVNIKRGLISV